MLGQPLFLVVSCSMTFGDRYNPDDAIHELTPEDSRHHSNKRDHKDKKHKHKDREKDKHKDKHKDSKEKKRKRPSQDGEAPARHSSGGELEDGEILEEGQVLSDPEERIQDEDALAARWVLIAVSSIFPS